MDGKRDVWQTVMVIEEALDHLDHTCAATMTEAQTLAAMNAMRRLADRIGAEAAIWTDRAAKTCAAEKAAGTPLSDYLATAEARNPKEALGVIHQASRITTDPQVRDAALAGTVSPTKAAAIGAVLRDLPRHEMTPAQRQAAAAELLNTAETSTTRQITGSADHVLERVAPDLAPSAADKAARLERQRRQAVKNRALHFSEETDGQVRFWGQLPTLEAAQLKAAVQAAVEHGRRDESDHIKALQQQRRSGTLADTEYFTARKQLAEQEARTTAQRQSDALLDLTRAAGETAGHNGGATRTGEAARLVVTLDYTSLLNLATTAAQSGTRPDDTAMTPDQLNRLTGTLETGQQIPASTLRRICCDVDILPAILGADSAVLDVGRTRRLITPQIRAALRLRDKTCVFPGCAIPAAVCDAHHITPWWAGGPTSLDNLATLCRHHHGVVEPDRFNPAADQWTITLNEHKRPKLTPPRRLARHLATAQDQAPAQGQTPEHRENSAHGSGVDFRGKAVVPPGTESSPAGMGHRDDDPPEQTPLIA